MIRTPEQRRAMFWRMRDPQRQYAFPLKGRGGTARRNRLIAAGAGTAALGSLALFGLSRGRRLPLTLVGKGGYMWAPTARVFKKGVGAVGDLKNSARLWVHQRPAEGLEEALVSIPGIGRLYGKPGIGKRPSMVYGISPQARLEARWTRRIKNTLASGIEKTSVWGLLGGRQRALSAIADAGGLLKRGVSRRINKINRYLTTPRIMEIKSPGWVTDIVPIKDKHGVLVGTTKVRKLETKASYVRRRKRLAPPVERLVTKPLDAIVRATRRADIWATRRMRRFARRHNL